MKSWPEMMREKAQGSTDCAFWMEAANAFSDIRSREETALKEVEFLCRQLDVLGYHKGANLSRSRCGLPEVAHG